MTKRGPKLDTSYLKAREPVVLYVECLLHSADMVTEMQYCSLPCFQRKAGAFFLCRTFISGGHSNFLLVKECSFSLRGTNAGVIDPT